MKELLEATQQSGQKQEQHPFKFYENSQQNWELQIVRISSNGEDPVQLLLSFREVNPQKNLSEAQPSEEFRWNQAEYRNFIEQNPDGIYSLDLQGNFTYANDGLAQLAEVSIAQLKEMNFLPFCAAHDKDRIVQYFEKALAGEACKFEADFIGAKGAELFIQISVIPMKWNDKIIGTYGIARNYTPIRNSERTVVEKSKFLEVNTSFISSLLEEELKKENLQKAFAVIGQTIVVDRMYFFKKEFPADKENSVINQLVEWTKWESQYTN